MRLGIALGVLSFSVSFGFGAASGRSSVRPEAPVTTGAPPQAVRALDVGPAEAEAAPSEDHVQVVPTVALPEQRVRVAAGRQARPAALRDDAARPPVADHQAERAATAARSGPRPGTVTERVVRDLHGILPDLDATDVRAVVGGQRARMQQCYARALRRAGRARDAAVRLTVDIAPEGNVTAASVEGEDLAALGECLEALAARWTFPRSRGGARVPIPLAFTAAN